MWEQSPEQFIARSKAEAMEKQSAGLQSLLDTGAFSDLTLKCSDGTEFKVHKAVVCSQSDFFKNACRPGGFKESHENCIELSFGESEIISSMVDHLYLRHLPDDFVYPRPKLFEGKTPADPIEVAAYKKEEDKQCKINGSKLLFLTKLWVAADFYAVPSLKELTQRYLNCSGNMLALTWSTKGPKLLDHVLDSLEYFYEHAPHECGKLGGPGYKLLNILIRHSECFKRHDKHKAHHLLERIVSNQEMAAHYIIELASECTGYQFLMCPNCYHDWGDDLERFKPTADGDVFCPKCGACSKMSKQEDFKSS